jgi:DNA-binding protein H-NS
MDADIRQQITDIRERRAGILEQMHEIIERAEDLERDITAEEYAHFESLEARFAKVDAEARKLVGEPPERPRPRRPNIAA